MYIGRRTKLLTSLPILAILCLLVVMRLLYPTPILTVGFFLILYEADLRVP
ncbi:hypothetical protein LINGRAHAP2_LOCUS35586 [Linum grandiflorum]